LATCVVTVALSAASFTDTTRNPQSVSAIADWTPPSAEASVIAPTSGSTPGYLKASASYYVYAKVVDSGNPASGIGSVKANVASLTSGQSAATLTAGSYTVGGVTYNYRSSQLTAGSSTGAKAYSVAMTDKAGNSATQQGLSVAVLGAFAGSGFETTGVGGGNEGKPEKDDTATFTFNSAPLPSSIVSGWSGVSPVTVSATIAQSSNNDKLEVSGANLGVVELKGNYVSKSVTFTGSTLTLDGDSVILTLGAPSSSGNLVDENGSTAPIWKPSSSAKDLAENSCSTSSVSGTKKRQF
jgi:hypothetical protein